jgi:hypothetical protein
MAEPRASERLVAATATPAAADLADVASVPCSGQASPSTCCRGAWQLAAFSLVGIHWPWLVAAGVGWRGNKKKRRSVGGVGVVTTV